MSKKTKDKRQSEKLINLEINDANYRFNVSLNEYHRYINNFNFSNKVTPSDQFVTACVHPDDSEALIDLLDQGYAVEIASTLAMEFKPELDIKVKPSSSESNL